MNRNLIVSFIAVFALATLYRVVPYTMRPEWLGAPQLAIALFAGSVMKSRKMAFAFPLFSMLLSDLVMQGLHMVDSSYYPGFYEGQLLNYALILSVTVIGFFVDQRKLGSIFGGAIASAFVYWVISNLFVWIGGGGYGHPKTFPGLVACYTDAVPFLRNSLAGTTIFSLVFFGINQLMAQPGAQRQSVKA